MNLKLEKLDWNILYKTLLFSKDYFKVQKYKIFQIFRIMKNWENSIENLINEARGEDVVSIYEYHSKCSRGIGAPGKI